MADERKPGDRQSGDQKDKKDDNRGRQGGDGRHTGEGDRERDQKDRVKKDQD